MDSLLIKPKNKQELTLLRGLLKKMEIHAEVVRETKHKKKKEQVRPYALSEGLFVVEDSFNEPLPEEILKNFYK